MWELNEIKYRKRFNIMKKNQIEYINALAPFDHGVWQGKSSDGERITVGDRALFCKRSEWLVDRITTNLIN